MSRHNHSKRKITNQIQQSYERKKKKQQTVEKFALIWKKSFFRVVVIQI